jgi:hypothetical protein
MEIHFSSAFIFDQYDRLVRPRLRQQQKGLAWGPGGNKRPWSPAAARRDSKHERMASITLTLPDHGITTRLQMLSGSLPRPETHTISARFAFHLLAHIALAPLFLFVGAVLIAGVLGLVGKLDQLRGGRGRWADLWPCFPATLTLILIILFVYWYFRRIKRRTILEFQYANSQLRYRTAECETAERNSVEIDGWITRPVADIREIAECPGTRGSMRIAFRSGPYAVVSPFMTNAAPLLEQLRRDLVANESG